MAWSVSGSGGRLSTSRREVSESERRRVARGATPYDKRSLPWSGLKFGALFGRKLFENQHWALGMAEDRLCHASHEEP